MASLTPGLLEKLLQNAGNKDVKVTGEHRSALLQVLEILPSLAGADDPWKSRGFFLKVSDSRHSSYVSVRDEDMDLIYSDKIQLGQFVYISGLDSGSPVPIVRGLKPVPKRRPCVGNPKDLMSSDVLNPKGNIQFGKNNGFKKNGVEGLQLRRLSLDSARRIWDHTPTPKSSSTGFNSSLKTSNHVNYQKKAVSKNDSPLKSPISSVSPLKRKNGVSSSPKHTGKPQKKDLKSTSCNNMPSSLIKVPVSIQTWSEERISGNTLSPAIRNLGKDIMHHRNAASLAAACALEEASAAETVILCLKAFGDLCGSSQKISSGPLVEQYLDLHQNMQKAAMVVNSLLTALPGGSNSSFYNKNAAFWVHAAVGTNLSKFIVFKKPEKSDGNTDTCHCVVLGSIKEELSYENQSPPKKQSSRNHRNLSGSIPKVASSLKHTLAAKTIDRRKDIYPKKAGLKETASLAEKLLLHSRQWFFKYIDNSLSNGFHFCIGEASEIACLLRQLKRVNQWLDDQTDGNNEKVEELRKKIYRFLLTHADSAGK